MGCVVNRSTAYLVAVSLAAAGFRGQQKGSNVLVAEEAFGIDGYISGGKKIVWDILLLVFDSEKVLKLKEVHKDLTQNFKRTVK